MKKNEKGFGLIGILILLVLVALIGGVGYYVYRSNKKPISSATQPQPTNIEPAKGYKRFENADHKFLFDYPDNLEVASEKIWIDIAQGGLNIGVMKPGTLNGKVLGVPEVTDSDGMLVKIEVLNTDLSKVANLDFISSSKVTFNICGVKATTGILTDYDLYVTSFQKNNLAFFFNTQRPTNERKLIHDNLVHSILCT
ncbi:MAG: hypothetical protein WCJ60_02710 [bacterium]